MKNDAGAIRDPNLRQVEPALLRAAARARELGVQTKTPVFIVRDGTIVDLTAEDARDQTRPSPSGPTPGSP